MNAPASPRHNVSSRPGRPRRSPVARVAAAILLIAAVIASLWVPLYARSSPKLGALPFFYWYQLILVIAVAVVSYVAYLLLRPVVPPPRPGPRRLRQRDPSRPGAGRGRRCEPHQRGLADDPDRAVRARDGDRVHRRQVAPRRRHAPSQRMGPRRPRLRLGDHLVPAGRRPLYRVHVHRRSRPACSRPARSASTRVSYTVMVFPIVFVFAARLWSVARASKAT